MTPEEATRAYPILAQFPYAHLPADLQAVTKPIADAAEAVLELPHSAHAAAGLRKLAEAREHLVTAVLQARAGRGDYPLGNPPFAPARTPEEKAAAKADLEAFAHEAVDRVFAPEPAHAPAPEAPPASTTPVPPPTVHTPAPPKKPFHRPLERPKPQRHQPKRR